MFYGSLERFTDRARKVMALANQEAQRFNHEYIGTEHLLLGLVKEGDGIGTNVLKNLEVDLNRVRLEVEKLVRRGPDINTMGKLPLTARAKKVLGFAMAEAGFLKHNYVGTEHLLLGLLREQDGVAAQVLINLGLKLEKVREETLNLLGPNNQSPEAEGEQGVVKTKAQPDCPLPDGFFYIATAACIYGIWYLVVQQNSSQGPALMGTIPISACPTDTFLPGMRILVIEGGGYRRVSIHSSPDSSPNPAPPAPEST